MDEQSGFLMITMMFVVESVAADHVAKVVEHAAAWLAERQPQPVILLAEEEMEEDTEVSEDQPWAE